MDKNKRCSWIFAPVRALIIKVVLVVVAVVAIVLVARHYINKVSSTSTPAVITKNEKIDITPSQIRSIEQIGEWSFLEINDEEMVDTVRHGFFSDDKLVRIYYGTNPGMGIGITETIPTLDTIDEEGQASFKKSLKYMGFEPGEKLLGHKIDYVFLGACTNGRIEDFRAFASIVKGKHKAEGVTAWLVPGSWLVDKQIREEGIDKIVEAAGFEIRQPGCSACLAMNDDKIPAGKYSVSTSNRNFEGRQGPGSRTILASPLVAAAAAVTGVITDPREFM